MEAVSSRTIIGPGFLDELGLPIHETALISLLVETGEVSSLDWLIVRDLMLSLETADEDCALLLFLSLAALNKGSLCVKMELTGLKGAAQVICGKTMTAQCKRIIDEMALVKLAKSRWSVLIGTSPDDFKPLILHEVGGSLYIYFQKNLINCLALQGYLTGLLDAPLVPVAESSRAKEILEHVINSQLHKLNPQQTLAAATAMLKQFAVISGGPGTGKTSIIVVLLRCFLNCGFTSETIAVVAPTGRAAQRMTESIQDQLPAALAECEVPIMDVTGTTIHSLLRFSPKTHAFTYNISNRLPHKVIIVDEVSMVDVELMSCLLSAAADDARILFLGDKDQLPSVEAGAVLAELIPKTAQTSFSSEFATLVGALLPDRDIPSGEHVSGGLDDCTIVLTHSYRSERSILDIAEEINKGRKEVVGKLKTVTYKNQLPDFTELDKGAYLAEIPTSTPEPIRAVLDSWAIDRYVRDTSESGWLNLVRQATRLDYSHLPTIGVEEVAVLDRLFDHLIDGQILTLVRKGIFGVEGINRHLGLQTRKLTDPNSRTPFFNGEPIIIRQNNRSMELFNGDLGIVLRDSSGGYRAFFKRMNEYRGYSIDTLPPAESAFAITVHKSQGSEYGRVLLVLPSKTDNPLLCKEIMYTGITRAKRHVVIAGDARVLATAVTRENYRESGVNLWGTSNDGGANAPDDFSDLPLFQ